MKMTKKQAKIILILGAAVLTAFYVFCIVTFVRSENYWLLLLILLSGISTVSQWQRYVRRLQGKQTDAVSGFDLLMKRWIPDDKVRSRVFLVILYVSVGIYAVILLPYTLAHLPVPIALFLSLFPPACAVVGFLIGKFFSKKK